LLRPAANQTHPNVFVVTLRNELEVPFKGFLIKTSRGEFTGTPDGTATKFCETALGAVTHTDAKPKQMLSVGLTLPDTEFDVTLQYYIVRTINEWFGPLSQFVSSADLETMQGTLAPCCTTLRARWVTLRARWVTLRARWRTLRARWRTLRARWVTLRARWVTLRDHWVTLRARWVTLRARW
jgi:hypothetical protein